MNAIHLLGIAGVEPHERPAARLWAKRLEWPMVLVVLWIPFQWYLEETQAIAPQLARIADWLVWLAFLAETVLLSALARNKRAYLFGNWMNLVIITGGMPFFWQFPPLIGLLRSIRLVLVVMLLVRLSKSARKLLSRHQLGNTLMVAFVTMVMSGIIISRIDPSIGTIWDGMWWAWVTMATVGYGDVVPHSGAGRLFGSPAMSRKWSGRSRKPTASSRKYPCGWSASSDCWKNSQACSAWSVRAHSSRI